MLFQIIACAVTGFLSIWFCFYTFLKIKCDLDHEWCCRLVTVVHAVIVTGLAGWAWHLGPDPFTNPGGPNTYAQELTLLVSLGYFWFDMAWCVTFQTEGATMMIHHACSIIIMTRVLMKGSSGTEATAGIFCLEITNPLLQARWFLRSAGYKGTFLFKVVELTFMLLFIFFRMFWGSYLCYKTFMHPLPDWESKMSAASFYILSWVFMYYVARYFTNNYILRQEHEYEESDIPSKTSPQSGISDRSTSDENASGIPSLDAPGTSYECTDDPCTSYEVKEKRL